jgi:hypothetical protein
MSVCLWKKAVAGAMVLALVGTGVLAETEGIRKDEDYSLGELAGKADARGNALWIIPGCLCGIIGIVVAIFVKPAPPAHQLVGKPANYVLGYSEAYKRAARWKNVGWATGGCILGTLLAATAFVLTGGMGMAAGGAAAN